MHLPACPAVHPPTHPPTRDPPLHTQIILEPDFSFSLLEDGDPLFRRMRQSMQARGLVRSTCALSHMVTYHGKNHRTMV